VLDHIESAFRDLALDPCGVALDGSTLGGWLPIPALGLHAMRDLLLKPPHPDAIPSIWRELVSRARHSEDPELWHVIVLGALNPGLRGICRRARLDPSHQDDLQAELVTQVLDRFSSLQPEDPRLAGELYWSARRAGSRFQRSVIEAEQRLAPFDSVSDRAVPPGGGHPDAALASLCANAVITEDEADLIGRTRLEGEPLAEAAGRLGITYAACRKRRRRAEHRIVLHYTSTGVLTAERARHLVDSSLTSLAAAPTGDEASRIAA
jgi:hypothetical protein